MQSQVETVLEDVRPLIQSVGIDAHAIAVDDGVVTVRLTILDHDARPDMLRLRDFVAREIQEEVSGVRDVLFEGDTGDGSKSSPPAAVASPAPVTPAVELVLPDDDRVTHGLLLFDKLVAPQSSLYFEQVYEAGPYPLLAKLLGLDAVVALLARDRTVVVHKSQGSWAELGQAMRTVVAEHFGGAPASSASVDTADEEDIRERVEVILEEDVNPAVESHGGYIKLLDVKGTDIYVHMGGGCQGCSSAAATLKQGIERAIRDAVPEVGQIIDTTDHAAGTNPYYGQQF